MLRPVFLVLTLSLSLPAAAGEVAEHALSAEAALEAQRPVDAMTAIESAVDRVWSAAPLVFRRSLFASSIEGFGRYEPRTEPRFKVGETLLIYAEPIGFDYAQVGEEFEIQLNADVEVRTPDGQVLGSANDFGEFRLRSRVKNREFNLQASIEVQDLKPGDYVLVLRARDLVSGKAGETELTFSVDGEPG